ncbi:MAG: BrnT family toxin [Alphaproteobacteria bacterium]|nr:BrnT family toxin [Alphaproteobacteria bacterium]
MKFEYDAAKSAANRAKHGIDFDRAQALWDDPWLLEAPARTEGEPRWLSIGLIDGRHWAAVWTRRGDTVRFISVRRARKEEIGYYEGA